MKAFGCVAKATGLVFLDAFAKKFPGLVTIGKARVWSELFFRAYRAWDQGGGKQHGDQHLGHQNLLPGRSTVVVTALEQNRRLQRIPPSNLQWTRIFQTVSEISNGTAHWVGGGV